CDVFNDLRESGALCDVTIKCDGRDFHVHRIIMSGCSPYFRALFSNDLSESFESEIIIPNVSAADMELIIQYAYSRQVHITEDNVEHLLPVADQFHILGLVKACSKFLLHHLSIENCLGIWQFAKAYFCTYLEHMTLKFILRNFGEISAVSNEILMLAPDELLSLLNSDDLNVRDERFAYEAAIRWISIKPDERKEYIVDILKSLRLGLIGTEYFMRHVKSNEFAVGNPDCKPIIIQTLALMHDFEMTNAMNLAIGNPLMRPRLPHEVLCSDQSHRGVRLLSDRWNLMDPDVEDTFEGSLSTARAYHGSVYLGGKIYVIGGFDGTEQFSSVRVFDPETLHFRCYVSVVVCEELIYAMGGYDGRHRMNTAERYNPKYNQWSFISPMHQQRSDASAATLDGHIYATGGFNGIVCMNSAERYDPVKKTWTPIAEMMTPRSNIAAIDDQIFAIGGFNGMTTVFYIVR
ncbi:kelch-like protein 10, partial [Lingula anatina]|uniref:Kelch-like protein 10 n=1 Tax=Lingula anatina TaxID=7574 RepID=A0A2R2MTL2_LINAN